MAAVDTANLRHYIGPWGWHPDEASDDHRGGWRPPPSAVSVVDLRPPVDAADDNGPAYFASTQPLDSAWTPLGTGDIREVRVTSRMRYVWQSILGVRPNGDTLADLLWFQLTGGADPGGEQRPRPLVPGVNRRLRLCLARHGHEVRGERFRWGAHAHTNLLQDVLRDTVSRMFTAASTDRHITKIRRVVGGLCRKYRVPFEQWREFVAAARQGDFPGPLDPTTFVPDDFNRSDQPLTDGPWDVLSGDYDVISNQCRQQLGFADYRMARHTTNLSSDDHYSEIEVHAVGGSNAGSSARIQTADGSTVTAYNAEFTGSFTALTKVEGGSRSVLDFTSESGSPATMRVECDGSTISYYHDGGLEDSVTDTSITGNTGIGMGGSGTNTQDNFEAADLAAGFAGSNTIIGGGIAA